MQHALMQTRTEVSGLEGDLSVVQAENRLQSTRLPQLRSQVDEARAKRATAEAEAAELAAELALYRQDAAEQEAAQPMSFAQRNAVVQVPNPNPNPNITSASTGKHRFLLLLLPFLLFTDMMPSNHHITVLSSS